MCFEQMAAAQLRTFRRVALEVSDVLGQKQGPRSFFPAALVRQPGSLRDKK
jgi:hypothetical protein